MPHRGYLAPHRAGVLRAPRHAARVGPARRGAWAVAPVRANRASAGATEETETPVALAPPLPVVFFCLLFITGLAGPRFDSKVDSRFGEMHVSFEDANSIPDISNLGGETTIDLSGLKPLDEPKTVNFDNGVGEINIILPNNVPVDVHCEATVGEITCPQGKQNADKDGELLTINVKQRVGSVSAYFAE